MSYILNDNTSEEAKRLGFLKRRTGAPLRLQNPVKPAEERETHLMGFGPMTPIACSFGNVPAHVLRERDRIRTQSGEFLEIKWIDRLVLNSEFLKFHPRAYPILLRAGALGAGLPKTDIMLAPFQTINPPAHLPSRNLLRAIDLLDRPSVFRQAEQMITYTRFHCGEPTSVSVEGLWMNVAP